MISNHHAFHWPDRTIGKKESRRIREEHNALYNFAHELNDAATALSTATAEALALREADLNIPEDVWLNIFSREAALRKIIEGKK